MAEEQTAFLVSQETYLKSGVHIGTRFSTKYMESFIYKIRPDGLSVLNIQKIDERLRLAANLISTYEPEDVLVVGRRETAWKAVRAFSRVTGIKAFAGRYAPGILTNPKLEDYFEVKLMLVVDAWPDHNAVKDAMNVGIPIIALSDSNNQSNEIDLVVPCNNKGRKSLGLIFYILAREYLKSRGQLKEGQEPPFKIEDFVEE